MLFRFWDAIKLEAHQVSPLIFIQHKRVRTYFELGWQFFYRVLRHPSPHHGFIKCFYLCETHAPRIMHDHLRARSKLETFHEQYGSVLFYACSIKGQLILYHTSLILFIYSQSGKKKWFLCFPLLGETMNNRKFVVCHSVILSAEQRLES